MHIRLCSQTGIKHCLFKFIICLTRSILFLQRVVTLDGSASHFQNGFHGILSVTSVRGPTHVQHPIKIDASSSVQAGIEDYCFHNRFQCFSAKSTSALLGTQLLLCLFQISHYFTRAKTGIDTEISIPAVYMLQSQSCSIEICTGLSCHDSPLVEKFTLDSTMENIYSHCTKRQKWVWDRQFHCRDIY